jgi:AcrR family transcriptional regulator
MSAENHEIGKREAQEEEKIKTILRTALSLLAKKGYENTTINDMEDTAGISRGLLHYYFKDKAELAARTLQFGFGPMWDSSIGKIQSARSAEQPVDTMIEVLKNNVRDNPDFSALLFEMRVSERRSAKIKKLFNEGIDEAIDRLTKLLEIAARIGIIKVDPKWSEGIIRMLLAIYHGLAIQLLIAGPEKIDDKKVGVPLRGILVSAFKTEEQEEAA